MRTLSWFIAVWLFCVDIKCHPIMFTLEARRKRCLRNLIRDETGVANIAFLTPIYL